MDTLCIKLETMDDKVMFRATARENPGVIIDYSPPIGTGKGYTSLELLMASYASCVSTTILTILRHKMHKTVDGVSARIEGNIRESHPKSLEHMHVALIIKAEDLTEPEVRQALKVAEEAMCPVWAMLKGNVTTDFLIEIDAGNRI